MKTFLFSVALAVLVTGCTHPDLARRRYDTREMRELQQQSVAGLPERPINGKEIRQFFSGKVALIKLAGSPVPVGRAVPLTRDGYMLTAWHVVDKGAFVLSDTVSLKPLPKREMSLVWHDAGMDLALVKFSFHPGAVFDPERVPPAVGDLVFSGAQGGNSGVLYGSARMDDGVGNGPYQTAGRVTKVRVKSTPVPHVVHHSTLVGRGGMSGGPVVTENGKLTGVVLRVDTHLFSSPTTAFTMIAPDSLDRIIREDRGRR
ncbi:MAG: serine protease [Verrucomicrobiaceae bacterium]|nr:MAG: serine protease [Verrucomicrobiaceae bacterium]